MKRRNEMRTFALSFAFTFALAFAKSLGTTCVFSKKQNRNNLN